MIVQYIKNNKGQRVGCLVGTKTGIGWSKVHGKLDKFDREKGLKIALGRSKKEYTFEVQEVHVNGKKNKFVVAKSKKEFVTALPFLVVKHLNKFSQRCDKYFHADV